MAQKGAIDLYLNTLPAEQRGPVGQAFKYVMDNLRWGQPDEGRRAENFQLYLRTSTTAAVANAEFSIAHGLSQTPTAIYPVLFLDQVGSQLVPLTVTRAADVNRVYLSSPTTSAVISVWIELALFVGVVIGNYTI
jgi:hypothetical protein